MIDGRMHLTHSYLGAGGVLFVSIDDSERNGLVTICDAHFGVDGRVGNLIWKGTTDNNPTRIAIEHEYILCYSKSKSDLDERWSAESSEVKDFMLAGYETICEQSASFQQRVSRFESFTDEHRERLGDLYRYRHVDNNGPYAARRNMENPGKPGYQDDVFHPVTQKACAKPNWGWRFPPETMRRFLDTDRLIFGADETKIPELKVYLREVRFPLRSLIQLDSRKGSNDLDRLFGARDIFKNPKPAELIERLLPFTTENESIVLDYFAGSGTTAHAVINLNRDDGGARRFILVEQGEYFDSVTLPRVAKVMASPDWKDGQPKDSVQHDAEASEEPEAHWSRRTLPLVQVLRIERYEDSLDALALPTQADALAAGQVELAGLDTVLRYIASTTAADNPVRLSTAALARPLDYRLPTVWEGRAVERPVDLLHTTCALLGLHLVRLRRLQHSAAPGAPLPCPAEHSTVLLAEVRPHRAGVAPHSLPLELLVLREHDVDGLSPTDLQAAMLAEHDWLAQAVQQHFGRPLASYALVRHNRDLLLHGEGEHGLSIDMPLAQAMWARDPSYSGANVLAAPTAAANAQAGG